MDFELHSISWLFIANDTVEGQKSSLLHTLEQHSHANFMLIFNIVKTGPFFIIHTRG